VLFDEQRRLIAPLFVHRPVTGRLASVVRYNTSTTLKKTYKSDDIIDLNSFLVI
jgi:hypothetical protein